MDSKLFGQALQLHGTHGTEEEEDSFIDKRRQKRWNEDIFYNDPFLLVRVNRSYANDSVKEKKEKGTSLNFTFSGGQKEGRMSFCRCTKCRGEFLPLFAASITFSSHLFSSSSAAHGTSLDVGVGPNSGPFLKTRCHPPSPPPPRVVAVIKTLSERGQRGSRYTYVADPEQSGAAA